MPDINAVVLRYFTIAADQHVTSCWIEPTQPVPVVAVAEGITLPAKAEVQGYVWTYLPLIANVPSPL